MQRMKYRRARFYTSTFSFTVLSPLPPFSGGAISASLREIPSF